MRTFENVYYRVVGQIFTERETGKAILMRVDFIDGVAIVPPSQQWFPKSQIADITYGGEEYVDDHSNDSIQATEWILEQKRLLKEIQGERVAKDQDAQERKADAPKQYKHADFDAMNDDIPF